MKDGSNIEMNWDVIPSVKPERGDDFSSKKNII